MTLKKLTVLSLILFCSMVCVAGSKQLVKTNVPFDFYVDDKLWAAGEYTIVMETGSPIVIIQSATNSGVFMVQNLGMSNFDGNTRLVFAKDGDRNVLHQIWIGGEEHGHDLLHDSSLEAPTIPRS